MYHFDKLICCVIQLIEDRGGYWILDMISSSWASLIWIFNPPALSRQWHLRCPCFLQLKQCPYLWRVACSPLLRAALAQVHPGVRSMTFQSLTNFCCHCWCMGFWDWPKGFWGWFLQLLKIFCHLWYFLCCLMIPSTQSLKWVNQSVSLNWIMDPWSPTGSPWKNQSQTISSSML